MFKSILQGDRCVRLAILCINLVFVLLLALWVAQPLLAQKTVPPEDQAKSDIPAEPDADSHYVIAMLVSTVEGNKNPRINATKLGARLRVEALNKSGGINGKPVRLLILDDHKNVDLTIKNVKQILSVSQLIAIVGVDSSTRGASIVEAVGRSGVPFISDISVDSLFASHENIFSMTSAISGDADVMTRFLGENYKRVAFIGLKGELFGEQIHSALTKKSNISLDAVHWLSGSFEEFAAQADEVIAGIKASPPDVLCVSVFSSRGAVFVKRLAAANLHIPIYFGTGSVHTVLKKTQGINYQASLFGIGRGIPNVEGERLAQLGSGNVFKKARVLYPDHLGNAVIYSDLLSLIATAAQHAAPAKNAPARTIAALRANIIAGLGEYRQGRKSFQGNWRNWSFTKARSSALSSFVLWAPDGGPKLQLWPVQHVHTLAGLQKAPVAFVNVDLVGIDHIDSNKHQFSAEFYLSMSSSASIDIEAMKFSNVVQGENGQRFLSVRQVHKGYSGNAKSRDDVEGAKGWINRLYLVKGQFRFIPRLGQYPFDSQRFSISIEPQNTTSPFLIQPNDATALNNGARIEGWRLIKGRPGEYVGYEEDDIIVVRDYGNDQQILPYYRFNFSWVAQRVTKDYFTRVVIPLVLILMVAYLSVLLPTEKIDSVVAMKVTALLSTVALYFSIPKLETETATLSDQIFVFSELIIVITVFISIIRVHAHVKQARVISRLLFGIELFVFPVAAFLMFRYVMAVSQGSVKSITEEPLASTLTKIMPQLF